jgi:hypothetical protein
MIGGVDTKTDISLYIDKDELERLSNQTIEGVLIRVGRPKMQGTVTISINNERNRENGSFGVGLDASRYSGFLDNFHIDVFIGIEWYQELVEKGKFGTRHSLRDGSKIAVYERSVLETIDRFVPENLDFYRDNRDRLTEEYL